MPEHIDFELRLGAAVKVFATNADAPFDSVEVASNALGVVNEGWLIRWPKRPSLGRRALAIAVAVIAFVGLAAVGLFYLNRPGLVGVHPTATPVPSSSSAPGTSTFISPLHGISIDYPSGWQTRPATEPWAGGSLDFNSAAADVIADPAFGEGPYLVLASQPHNNLFQLPWTDLVDSWFCPIVGDEPAGSREPAGSVDGNQAFARVCGSTHVATFIGGTRGYVIALIGSGDWASWVSFKSMLDTVDVRPEEAVDASPAPLASPEPGFSRFTSPLQGMSIDYPSAWRVTPATDLWGGRIEFDAPDMDSMFDPQFGADLYLAVASQPLGNRSQLSWVGDHRDSPSLGVCYSGGGGGIGNGFQDNPAWPAWFQHCAAGPGYPNGVDGWIVIFATPTRGYVIYLHSYQSSLSDPEGWFDARLATVQIEEANR